MVVSRTIEGFPKRIESYLMPLFIRKIVGSAIALAVAPTRRLQVPVVSQEDEFYCVPACLKMVLEYLNNGTLKVPTPNFTVEEIARIVKTQDGTWVHEVPLINPRIINAVPSVEFEDEYKSRRIEEIKTELSAGRPVIALMELTDGVHRAWHAVVVTDINLDENKIWFNDPAVGEVTMSLRQFQALWERAFTTLIKVQIGRATRTVIEQYTGVANTP